VEAVSARIDGRLAFSMWVIVEGMVEGSVGEGVDRVRRVMGPEWSFWAAVMAEQVAGARVVVVDGSAIMRVEA